MNLSTSIPIRTRRRGLLAGAAGLALGFRPLALAAEPLPLVEVAAGVLVRVGALEDFTPANLGGIANLGLVVGTRAAAVIDTGGSDADGRRFLAAIRARTDLPIAYVINTHDHPDHIFGNSAFEGLGATFVGHERLVRAMAERGPLYMDNMRRNLGAACAGTHRVPPTVLVPEATPLELDLGGRRLHLRAWPTAHTGCDLTALDRGSNTLMAGDLVFMERLPVDDGSLDGWLGVLDRLAAVPADRVVPGHGPASAPWPAALDAERGYLVWLRASVRRIIEEGVPLGRAVAAVPLPTDERWQLTAGNHARNVIASYTELEWE
jgi:quinoprotein relay system zinc metallohydrolase 2